MGLLRGPGSSEHFPRISRNPLGNHTPRGSGMVSGRGHGKSSRGWGPWAGVPVHQHHVLPHRWTRARRRLLSRCRPRAVSYSGTIFGPQRKRKRKQRKEFLFSVEPLPGKDSRACWAREGSHCWIKRSCT